MFLNRRPSWFNFEGNFHKLCKCRVGLHAGYLIIYNFFLFCCCNEDEMEESSNSSDDDDVFVDAVSIISTDKEAEEVDENFQDIEVFQQPTKEVEPDFQEIRPISRTTSVMSVSSLDTVRN